MDVRDVRLLLTALCVGTVAFCAEAGVKYAAPGGTGSGADWGDAGDAVTLIAAAEAGDEIRFKEGLYDLTSGGASSAAAITLSGGWTGEGDARGGETVFANAPSTAGTALTLSAASGLVTLDSLTFSNCYTRGVSKSGASSLFVTNCAFKANGTASNNKIQGRGAYLAGGTGARLDVVDSRILDNRMPSGGSNGNSAANAGQGFYVASFASARFEDCAFARNGQHATTDSANWRDCSAGAALYVTGVPVFLTNCTFRANRGTSNGSADGGIVALAGAVGGSVLDHCLFVGNSHAPYGTAGKSGTVQMWGTGAVTLNHCTVAYNATVGLGGGINACSGTLNVRNSVVAYNTCVDDSKGGADFYVGGGTVNVSDSVVTGTSEPYVSLQSGSIVFDPLTVKAADPLFASTPDEYAACLTPAQTGYKPRLPAKFKFSLSSAYETLDVHLRSLAGRWMGSGWTKDAAQSPAIDQAAADAPYAKEDGGGAKNGNRANAGTYGNTAEASLTSVTRPSFASATAAMSGDGTRVAYTCALAQLAGGDDPYSAALYLCYGTEEGSGLSGWDRVETVDPSAAAGNSYAYKAPKHFANGDTVHWQFYARTGGGLTAVTNGTIAITGTPPPSFGHGGGADVIHVWAGAQGTCGGTNWLDACTNVYDAVALVTATRTNIWIAGTVEPGARAPLVRAVAVRGGFTAMEDKPEDRPAGERAVVDAVKAFDACLVLTAGSGCSVLENLVLTNAVLHGVEKSGAASLFVTNCAFACNGTTTGASQGRGAYLTGGSGARLDCVDVTVVENRTSSGGSNGSNLANAGNGFYVLSFAGVRLVNCAFLGNGQLHTATSGNYRDCSAGAALYASGAPIAATNCTFVGNRGMSHNESNDGGVLRLDGAMGATVFDHCLFAGNSHACYGNVMRSGTVFVSGSSGTATFNHCTIAYNATSGKCGGIFAKAGTTYVRNSIVANNTCTTASGSASAADILTYGGTVDVRDSLITADDSTCVYRESGTLTVDSDTVKTGDPLFATTRDEFVAALAPATSAFASQYSSERHFSARVPAFDLHLRSAEGRWTGSGWTKDAEISPAIDAGAEDAPYANEGIDGEKNGERANAGFYGNTAEASLTVEANITIENAKAAMAGDGTRVRYTFSLADGAPYMATVCLCTGLTKPTGSGTAGWDEVIVLSTAATPGMAFDFTHPRHYASDTNLYWRVYVSTAAGKNDTAEGSLTIVGTPPPNFGRGGGADVIHVWAGGQGTCGGRDWLDACTNLADAAALVAGTRTNIWIAGTVAGHNGSMNAPGTELAVTIRGGFTAFEDSPADRPDDGSRARVEDGATYARPHFTASSGTIHLERIDFTGARQQGFYKDGGASLEAHDCSFDRNGLTIDTIAGRGLYAVGTAAGTLTLSNCTFRGNICPYYLYNFNESGCGAYVSGFGLATITDCLFETNGIARTDSESNGAARDNTDGFGLHLNAPAVVERCRFAGTTGVSNYGSDGKAIHVLQPAVFRNCSFTGTQIQPAGSNAKTDAGTLVFELPSAASTSLVDNCTFAYNASCGALCAGVTVSKGNVRISNSIFAANVTKQRTVNASDVWLSSANASATVEYSLFDAIDASHTGAVAGATLTWGEGNRAAEARFATPREAFWADLKPAPAETAAVVTSAFWFKPSAQIGRYNVHLRGKGGYVDETTGRLVRWKNEPNSPGIDEGDPAAPYEREPKPNGHRLNMGAYGNTPWATSATRCGFYLLIR